MKKLLCVLFMFALLLTVALTVYADGSTTCTTDGSEVSCDIQADYVADASTVTHAFSVTVSWTQSGTLRYSSKGGSYTWDPNNLQYSGTSTDASWTIDDPKISITIVNRSDMGVTATCEVKPNSGLGIYGNFDKSTLQLASAAQGLTGYTGTGTATTATATYTITQIIGSITASGSIGNIGVTLTADGT